MASPWSFTPPTNPFGGTYSSSQSVGRNGGYGEGEPCEPGYKKHPTQDGWECIPDGSGNSDGGGGSETGLNVYGCPGDQVKINLDENGKQGTEVCVSQEEAQRRNKLWVQQNPGNEPEGGGGGGGGGSSTGAYKPPTYTPTKSPYDAELSKQLFETLTNMINGGDAPFGPDTIAKLQAAALQSNKGQLANSRTELQRRLINSGLSRSGAAPASFQKLESAAGADLSNNFRSVAVNAVQQNYNARVTALNQAQQFLQSERANALSQDQLILAYARLKQEWATTQAGYAQQWKIVQNGNEQELMRLMLCLRTPGCTI